MNVVPIVNELDEIVTYKERDQIDPKLDIYRGASLWITNDNNEVLLAQRKYTKKLDPGKWGEAVGGTVENKDSYIKTVIREAEEELGLVNINILSGPKHLIRGQYNYYTQWFTVKLDIPIEHFIIQESEVESIKWMPVDELIEDFKINPTKYISSMKDILRIFNLM